MKHNLDPVPMRDEIVTDKDRRPTPRWQKWLEGLFGMLQFQYVESTLDFGNTAAQTHTDIDVAVTGAELLTPVWLGIPDAAMLDGCTYTAWVSATDIVTVRFLNASSSAKDPSSLNFSITVRVSR